MATDINKEAVEAFNRASFEARLNPFWSPQERAFAMMRYDNTIMLSRMRNRAIKANYTAMVIDRVHKDVDSLCRASCGPMTVYQFKAMCYAKGFPSKVQQQVLEKLDAVKRVMDEVSVVKLRDLRIVVDGNPSTSENVKILAPQRDGTDRWRVLASFTLEITHDFMIRDMSYLVYQ